MSLAHSGRLFRYGLIFIAGVAVFGASVAVSDIVLQEAFKLRAKAAQDTRDAGAIARAQAINAVLEGLSDKLRLFGANLLRALPPPSPAAKRPIHAPAPSPVKPPSTTPELENERTILFLTVIDLADPELPKVLARAVNPALTTQMALDPAVLEKQHTKLLGAVAKEGPDFIRSERIEGDFSVLTLATPLETDDAGKPIKAMLASFKAETLSRLLPNETPSELTVLVNARGKVIAHADLNQLTKLQRGEVRLPAGAISQRPIDVAGLQVQVISNDSAMTAARNELQAQSMKLGGASAAVVLIILYFLAVAGQGGGHRISMPSAPGSSSVTIIDSGNSEKTGRNFLEKLAPQTYRSAAPEGAPANTQVTYVLDPQAQASRSVVTSVQTQAPPAPTTPATPPPFSGLTTSTRAPDKEPTLSNLEVPPLVFEAIPAKSDPTNPGNSGSGGSAA